ncbi:MAG: indolepyruvate ferredoxin oxidoreductase subunit alpha [Dehalococcoidales bacterium]|nr:indolepyruvate ferredoxin oxidoreductase subunit alpha [Dehalococcoidales bacterium]
MKKLLSGNEAIALGAYHAGVKVATAYPGTPSTEILEYISQYSNVYAEWSTNEKVALEVALGSAYGGARSMVSMKHVGLNVAGDPFMAASTTGINAGLVIIVADDPGMHSSQNEQDTRYYAKLAKIPVLEPSDSQEAYDFMTLAFNISEKFDTPVLVRSTTRISHSKSAVTITGQRENTDANIKYSRDFEKNVLLPVNARIRHAQIEKRLLELAAYAEIIPVNTVETGNSNLGIISSGIAYQYARQTFPKASFLKLGMPYPLPQELIQNFASQTEKLLVIEELDPFIEEHILMLGIKIIGKKYIPLIGELNPDIVADCGRKAHLLPKATSRKTISLINNLPGRPPLLCAGCPHTGIFFVLSSIDHRNRISGNDDELNSKLSMAITGDIGCYTLAALPPLNAMDTCACMGASIGQALGLEKAGLASKIVAVIGDSTFLHSGITPLVNAVYNKGQITVIILDNGTTAMTGHQHNPGTGITAQGETTQQVYLGNLVRGIGVKDVQIVNAYNMKELRNAVRNSLDNPELSVIIVRGTCQVIAPKISSPNYIDKDKCNQCNICSMIGCPAIQYQDEQVYINDTLCAGDDCAICAQICPQNAIISQTIVKKV